MEEKKNLQEFTFSCKQCGASLVFNLDVGALRCEYCGFVNKITVEDKVIVEHNFKEAIETIEKNKSLKPLEDFTAKCPKCAGEFKIKSYQRTTTCPYCRTPVLTNIDAFYDLHPESILPFKISRKIAKKNFRKWIGSLWFAPNDLKKCFDSEKFEAIYLPFWTYDANTTTYYTGQRGDIYYVDVQKEVIVNGVRELKTVREQRIDWSFAAGVVHRFFDDILIGASKSVSRILIDELAPWDLENLVAYEDEFLSGYESETYQVALDYGFKEAGKKMEVIIREDVKRDIGGDRQRIDSLKTHYNNVTFKYILLPMYKSEFKYSGKKYEIVINARSGKVSGDRPYSYVKIFFIVFIFLLIFIALFFYDDFLKTR
jgi:DNA-directed RNA polymerase subunit RPC12/RpoP